MLEQTGAKQAHLEELRAEVAKEWLLSTAPTRRLLGNPVPPAMEGSGPEGTLIFTLPGCPRTVLQAEHSHLPRSAICQRWVAPRPPPFPQLYEGWGTRASQIPRFCSLWSQKSKSEANQF